MRWESSASWWGLLSGPVLCDSRTVTMFWILGRDKGTASNLEGLLKEKPSSITKQLHVCRSKHLRSPAPTTSPHPGAKLLTPRVTEDPWVPSYPADPTSRRLALLHSYRCCPGHMLHFCCP